MNSGEINPSIFLQLLNTDPDERNKATEVISQFIHLIDFFHYLVKLLTTPEINQNTSLLTQILIVLKVSVKKLYNECSIINEAFEKAIPISLINLLTSIPVELHAHIVDCFRHINEETYKKGNVLCRDDQSLLHLVQLSVIPNIVESIKTQNNFITNLSIFKIFVKFYIRENENERNQQFFNECFQIIIPVIYTVLNSEELNEFTAKSAKLSAQLLFNLVDSGLVLFVESFTEEMTLSMIAHYSQYFTTLFSISSSLNRHLLRLNCLFFNIYYGNDTLLNSIVPFFFQSSISILSNQELNFSDIYLQTWALKLLYHLMDPTNRLPDGFDYFQFIKTILIPFAAITDEEASDILSMPYLISSYYIFDDENPSSSPRREMCRKLGSILFRDPNLFSIVLQLDPSNSAFFESCIFLVSCVDNFCSLVPNEMIDFILSANFPDYSPLIQASFLYLLNRFAKHIKECNKLVDLTIYLICQTDQPIVILAALDLLKNTHLIISTCSDLSQLNIMIPKVLSLFATIHYWDSINVLAKTIVYDENTESYLNQLLLAIYQNCFVCVQEVEGEFVDKDCFGLSNSIHLLISIFDKINLTDEIIAFSYQQLGLLFPLLKDDRQIESLFNLLSFFNYQLRPPLDIQFDFIMLCYNANNEIRPFILDSVYPLILNPHSNISNRSEFIGLIVEICERYIQLFERGENYMYIFNKNSLIRLCGALIEIFGEQCLNLSRIAFIFGEYSYDDPSYPFSSLLYLLFVSIKANCNAIFSLFNENMMRVLLCKSIPSIYHFEFSKNEIKSHFCILLMMARKGFENLSEALTKYQQRSFEYALEVAKSFTSAFDWDISEDDDPYRNYDQLTADRFYPNCLNVFNQFQLFDEIVSALGIELSEGATKLMLNLRNT